MGRFDRQAATAKRLIAKYGQVSTWRQVTNISDPIKPWETTQTVINTDLPLVFLTNKRIGWEFLKALKALGGDVPAGDEYALMARTTFIPQLTDTVIRNGVTYRVDTISPLAPNGEIIMYTVKFKI